jgi:hypothetical protein
MTLSACARAVACAAVVVAVPIRLSAQRAVGVATTASSAVRSHTTTNPWVQRGWISAGAGVGSYPYGVRPRRDRDREGGLLSHVNYNAFALTVDLGWFGDW